MRPLLGGGGDFPGVAPRPTGGIRRLRSRAMAGQGGLFISSAAAPCALFPEPPSRALFSYTSFRAALPHPAHAAPNLRGLGSRPGRSPGKPVGEAEAAAASFSPPASSQPFLWPGGPEETAEAPAGNDPAAPAAVPGPVLPSSRLRAGGAQRRR